MKECREVAIGAWDEIKTESDSEPIRLATCLRSFQSAIKRRNGNDEATAAYLSGGLDSRCIVAALCHNLVRVRTVNFARPGTQDYHLEMILPRKSDPSTSVFPKKKATTFPTIRPLMAKAWEGSNHGHGPRSARNGLVGRRRSGVLGVSALANPSSP